MRGRNTGRGPLTRLLAVITLGLALAGCAGGFAEKRQHLGGLPAELDRADVGAFAGSQTEVMNHLVVLSGQPGAPENAIQWRPVVEAGIDYVDARCERYIDSIFWFNRQKNTVRNQVDLVGAATAGILGATEAAAKSIALTAIAFGLGSQSIENYGKGLLYEVDPSALRGLVEKSQAAYMTGLEGATYTNRAAAMRAIRGYLALCLPATLESEVNKSVSQSQFTQVEPLQGASKQNLVPQVDQVPPQRVVFTGAAVVRARPLRERLSNAEGRLDRDKVDAMRRRCWPSAGVPADTALTDFLLDDRFADARAAVTACMGPA